jgi:hypothetical protein
MHVLCLLCNTTSDYSVIQKSWLCITLTQQFYEKLYILIISSIELYYPKLSGEFSSYYYSVRGVALVSICRA